MTENLYPADLNGEDPSRKFANEPAAGKTVADRLQTSERDSDQPQIDLLPEGKVQITLPNVAGRPTVIADAAGFHYPPGEDPAHVQALNDKWWDEWDNGIRDEALIARIGDISDFVSENELRQSELTSVSAEEATEKLDRALYLYGDLRLYHHQHPGNGFASSADGHRDPIVTGAALAGSRYTEEYIAALRSALGAADAVLRHPDTSALDQTATVRDVHRYVTVLTVAQGLRDAVRSHFNESTQPVISAFGDNVKRLDIPGMAPGSFFRVNESNGIAGYIPGPLPPSDRRPNDLDADVNAIREYAASHEIDPIPTAFDGTAIRAAVQKTFVKVGRLTPAGAGVINAVNPYPASASPAARAAELTGYRDRQADAFAFVRDQVGRALWFLEHPEVIRDDHSNCWQIVSDLVQVARFTQTIVELFPGRAERPVYDLPSPAESAAPAPPQPDPDISRAGRLGRWGKLWWKDN